ncbi:16S rRNA (guanine(527)-N(7))-methyltransferase RsmG [Legionella micdadei]|uniref:Ribosomal RNA small subunit methyltransferase G n=1 Tax=Legionella micdadei TaxID=451 RepID=A0A098GAF8_LEGMI|nr:16S rRNA (guanine(527)-N(7))-methyltransferase RsmG [Legionella micdadei]ARG99040.1 16S rRNA methyltransferase G [Legionella micdadei]KTD29108.1 glucose inhibited division protein B GidB [Legionella micdadei]NSL19395.1 16S rRNA (guanine(527)-N(7))-methyltransferase RsmG [Legionella micdadei]CEG59474.1 Ribosomal RNA small subunit methyltransferase G [Legionella micdadei]SCX90984.1 16S rRNA (guanine527-N7)-methyltransferase [Legionella micdadei]
MTLPETSLQTLVSGIDELGLSVAANPLMQYLLLLRKWNQTYNLTAVRDLETMVSRHVLDSLAIIPWIRSNRVLDVGTGAGLPGIPLALAIPDLQITLLDSSGKKIRFLQEVKRHLQLNNIEVVQSRVENYHPSFDFGTVTSRAFSDLAQMIEWTQHLVGINGIWLAMKGRYPETELAGIHLPYQVHSYKVPGMDVERCCVIIEKATKE